MTSGVGLACIALFVARPTHDRMTRTRTVARCASPLPAAQPPAPPGGGGRGHLAEHLVESGEEALVLGARPVGDAQATLLAERPPRPYDHAALGEALDDRVLVPVAEVDPGEVRLGPGRRESALVERFLHVQPLDERALAAHGDLVAVGDRLRRGNLRERVDRERLADAVAGDAEVLGPDRIPDP